MMLFSLAIALVAGEPRFVMTGLPGESVRAEVFLDLSGDREAQAAELLGGPGETGTVKHEGVAFPYVAGAETTQGARPLVIFEPAGPGSGHRACRVTPTGESLIDSSQRALAWCATFLGAPLAVRPDQPTHLTE